MDVIPPSSTEKILDILVSPESARIVYMKPWEIDEEEFATQANDMEIAVGVGHDFPHPYTKENAVWFMNQAKKTWHNGSEYEFALREKTSNEFFGMIGFKVRGTEVTNIGYWLARKSWGNGYATEALQATIELIKKHLPEVNSIQASVYKYNTASQSVLEKNGFVLSGERRGPKDVLRNNQKDDSNLFTLTLTR